ncbi:formate dehydrogenase accessory sulfurtransferase FdhD [Roseateles saccharophilus]|uniref:Sulfur carrier protein FdhD n=1 Tax=Roseateles saccharophilus TaxID=304 RepID=A0A4R3U6R0_ROSSA|nr:formate dehydrogenase accessory sulfurtransferase FdhD [Roseateles saccharophilus]MDG0835827.1 formate dehydrogenase accessory sulfurtransferase FdhD [Roseateles saccharophilus]TCU83412.1 FdhD protein/phenylacetyl-CoA:acceptor oxidoreductase accessory protein [Roseateles saccharophilus]
MLHAPLPLTEALLKLRPPGSSADEEIAVEMPVALTVNGVSQAVMLATPANLEDFALGFALAEGWVSYPGELLDVETELRPQGIELALTVTATREQSLKLRRRQLAGRTGCGLCGLESLADFASLRPPPVQAPELAPGALARAMAELHSAQVLNARCGGLHAAAWCALDGALRLAREDVGRHNALDKLIGARATAAGGPAAGFVAISSRASHELVHKAAMAGIGLLACVSAPTSLAVSTAQGLGLQLWAFVREGRATRYA